MQISGYTSQRENAFWKREKILPKQTTDVYGLQTPGTFKTCELQVSY